MDLLAGGKGGGRRRKTAAKNLIPWDLANSWNGANDFTYLTWFPKRQLQPYPLIPDLDLETQLQWASLSSHKISTLSIH